MGVYGPRAADSNNATDVEVIRSSSVVSQLEKFDDLGGAPNVVIHARLHRRSAWVWVGEPLVWAAKVECMKWDCDGRDVVLDLLLNPFVSLVNQRIPNPHREILALHIARADPARVWVS